MFQRTHQIADKLIEAGELPADEFIDMECSDPEWYVALHVRALAFRWAVKRWCSRVTARQSRAAHR